MSIAVVCPQGHKLTAKDQLAGKRVKCPKCGAVVQIPEPSLPELGDNAVLLDASPQRLDAPSDPLTPGALPSRHDPLGDAGYGLQPLNAIPPLPTVPAASLSPAANSWTASPAPEPSAPATANLALVVALAVGGGFALVLAVGVVVWMLLAGGNDRGPVVAKNELPPQPAAPLPPVQAAPQPPVVAPPPAPEAPMLTPSVPARPSTPWDLTRFDMDPRLEGFKLADKTWAAAYDEVSGRLAITHDEQGILIYDIDDILAGDLSPVAKLPTQGLPMAVCIKPLGTRRLLVVAGQAEPEVAVFDLESLEAQAKVRIPEITYIDFLTGSTNPADPFVYFSSDPNDRGRENSGRPKTTGRLGRVDLATGQHGGFSLESYADVAVSADGNILYARPDRSISGYLGTWSEVATERRADGTPARQWQDNEKDPPLRLLGQAVAQENEIYSPSLAVYVAYGDFAPAAAFKHHPVAFGLSKDSLVFGSANNYRSLTSIPLPGDWLRTAPGGHASEPRLRPYLSPIIKTPFIDFQTDSTRGLGLMITGEHLVIASLAKAELPQEPSLIVRTPFPEKVSVGQLVEISLDAEAADAVFEFLPHAEGMLGQNNRPKLLGEVVAPSTYNLLALAAAVDNQQRTIFIKNIDKFSGAKLPVQIQIDDEVMTVTSIDDFKEALIVERTAPVEHSVIAKVRRLDEKPAAAPSLPVVEGKTFRWTPSPDLIGRHTIRMRARSGKIAHEWFWEAEVVQGTSELPFYVLGVEPEDGGSRAVIWGQSSPVGAVSSAPTVYFVGIYDLAAEQLVHHVPIDKPISAATLHSSGVYAAIISYDTVVKADRQAEQERQRAASKATPTEIVRLHPETLKIVDKAAIADHCQRVQVIGGKYLAAFQRGMGETFRLKLSDLTAVTPAVTRQYRYPIAGRVHNGWVWDGVLWDEEFKTPRLLLFPVHFEIGMHLHENPTMVAAEGGTTFLWPAGPYVCTWFPQQREYGQHFLRDYPGALVCQEGQVQLLSWANTSRVDIGSKRVPDAAVMLVNLQSTRLPPGVNYGDETFRQMFSGYVTESNGEVYVAFQGKLYSFPLSRLVKEETPFRFVEQQEQFVLTAGQRATLKYSAPGAVNYHFQLWYDRPNSFDDKPVLAAESSDGTFEIEVPTELPSALGSARGAGGGALRGSGNDYVHPMAEYLKRIGPVYQQLTGKRLRGIPFPVYASVIAEHSDGVQKAGLAHCYLIEVPALQPPRDRR